MFIAWIVIGVIATGQATLITGSHPFDSRESCDAYLDDLTATVEDGNSRREPENRLNIAAFCLATPKGV